MEKVTVSNTIAQNVSNTWELWTSPEHIMNWNFATPEWHCPKAENELSVGGRFDYHMAAKDGTMDFDYCGTFTTVDAPKLLEFKLDDGRYVSVRFIDLDERTEVIETFDVEDVNSVDLQRHGWQAILDNFKTYAESVDI